MPRYSLGHTSGTDCNDFQAAPQHQLVMALRQKTWKHRGAHTEQKHMTPQFTKTLCFAIEMLRADLRPQGRALGFREI